jgi:hypothetical protein
LIAYTASIHKKNHIVPWSNLVSDGSGTAIFIYYLCKFAVSVHSHTSVTFLTSTFSKIPPSCSNFNPFYPELSVRIYTYHNNGAR